MRRGLIVSSGWLQASILVILVGFSIMLYLAYRANVDAPPIPSRVTDPSGRVLFTGEDILAGLIVAVALIRNHGEADALVLMPTLLAVALFAWRRIGATLFVRH
jgi:nitric oxide reductase large subunit